jgi:hypothetical protein
LPYLSWSDGGVLLRHFLEGDCLLGRDASLCAAVRPSDPTVSRTHALVSQQGGEWRIQDLESQNGTRVGGQPIAQPAPLRDGDAVQLGDWRLTFSEHFPGLDGVQFVEGVGSLFTEVRPEPSQALALIRGMELLQRSIESLLQEGNTETFLQSLLSEALKLLRADRGFIVMLEPDGSWRWAGHIGGAEEGGGLSHTILNYVASRKTAVLSNAPMLDPRFQGASVASMHRGALLCAPMALDAAVLGMLYLDRLDEGRPFGRFDLSLFQAFVRMGTVTLRHTQLAQKALGQAQVQGELLRVKTRFGQCQAHIRDLLMEMLASLRWVRGTGQETEGLLTHQMERLQYLAETALLDITHEAGGREVSATVPLETFQATVEAAWTDLARFQAAQLWLQPGAMGAIWISPLLAQHATQGLVEPLLMRLDAGQMVTGAWQEEGALWIWKLQFPPGTLAPSPEAWTLQALRELGLTWRWADYALSLGFPKGVEVTPALPPLPLLGLVTRDHEMTRLFERVAEASGCLLFPLEEDPPRAPLSRFRYLVVDVQDLLDPVATLHAYRRHPGFAPVPILVIKALEVHFPDLLAAGATDWLPEGFRWETLHHRLQVLQGHEELQRKALAAERLDSFQQMAGALKHEINNPLAVISIQVELLQRKYPEEPKLDKIGEMVERIRGLVQVLQKMREAPTEEYPGGGHIVKLG